MLFYYKFIQQLASLQHTSFSYKPDCSFFFLFQLFLHFSKEIIFFRHLYVLATEARWIQIVNVDTGLSMYAPLEVTIKETDHYAETSFCEITPAFFQNEQWYVTVGKINFSFSFQILNWQSLGFGFMSYFMFCYLKRFELWLMILLIFFLYQLDFLKMYVQYAQLL